MLSPTGPCGSSGSPCSSTGWTSTSSGASSDQLKAAFGVGDTAIGAPVLGVHPGQRDRHAAVGLPGRPLEPDPGHGGDHRRCGRSSAPWAAWCPPSAFGLLVVIRGSLGFGQAITDPSGSSVIADFYGTERRGQGLLHPAVPELRRPRRGPRHRRRPRPALPRPGLAGGLLRLALPRAPRRLHVLAAARAEPRHGGPGARDAQRRDGGGRRRRAAPLPARVPPLPRATWSTGCARTCGTILRIPTMRYALVGVSTVGFVVTAVGDLDADFYQNQLDLTQQAANGDLRRCWPSSAASPAPSRAGGSPTGG